MTSFFCLEYFNAFELDVNVVNFVYYGKTPKVLFRKKFGFEFQCIRFILNRSEHQCTVAVHDTSACVLMNVTGHVLVHQNAATNMMAEGM